MTSTTGTTMPRIAKFTHKKDLPFREYTLVLTPNGGDRNYTWSDIVSFRIALGNDKLRCVYGSQTYGTFQIQLTFSDAGGNLTTSTTFAGSANSIFARITTTSNGGVLEDFNKCNVYIPVVYDLTFDKCTRNNYYSFFGNSTTPYGLVASEAPTVETCKTGGQIISVALAGAGSSTSRSFGFIIPSIIGSFSKKL